MDLNSVLHAWIIQNILVEDAIENDIFQFVSDKYCDGNFIAVFHASNRSDSRRLLTFTRILNQKTLRTIQIHDKKVEANPFKEVKSDAMLLLFEGGHDERSVSGRLRDFQSTQIWNSRGRILIIADGAPKGYMSDVWKISKAVNVVFWMLGKNKFYSWEPYKGEQCDITGTIREVPMDEMFVELDLTNLNGCPLYAVSRYGPPFVMDDATGVETKLMEIIAENLNCQLRQVEIPPDEFFWDSVSPEGKPVGAMGMLDRREADIAYSSLSLNFDRCRYGEPLTSYLQDEIVWIVPSPEVDHNNFKFHEIFQLSTWLLLSALFALITALMYYIDGGKSLTVCILNALYASLNMPIKSESKLMPMLLYFWAVHIATVYQAMLLYSLVREVRYKPIETLQEAVDANLFAFLPPSLNVYFNRGDHHLWEKILQPDRHSLSYDLANHIMEIVVNKSAIALYPKSMIMYAVDLLFIDGNTGPKLLILEERVSASPLAFYTPKDHPLKSILDLRMNQLITSGLPGVWLRRKLGKIQWSDGRDLKTESQERPLNMTNVKTIFFVYLAFNCFSFGVFVFEILIHFVLWKISETEFNWPINSQIFIREPKLQ